MTNVGPSSSRARRRLSGRVWAAPSSDARLLVVFLRGAYDAATASIVRAFQRHWRPTRVDGVADGETRARLIALLRMAAT